MIRANLAPRVARELSLPRTAADRTAAPVFTTIAKTLGRGESVTIEGFSTFTIRRREVRQRRNPHTGECIAIAASTVPWFKAGKALRDAVKARQAQSAPRSRPGGVREPAVAIFVAGRRRGALHNSPLVRTHAPRCPDIGYLLSGHSLSSEN